MKLILTHDVAGLGQAGEVVEVKDGYGRNYLIPRGYATAWTKGGQKQVDQIAEARRKRAIASLDEAHALRDSLQADTLQIAKSAGENGRLYGAVTNADIATAATRKFFTPQVSLEGRVGFGEVGNNDYNKFGVAAKYRF